MIDSQELFVDTAPEPKSNGTMRSVRKLDLQDPKLLTEYQAYQEATESYVEPVSLEEFAASIRPTMATSVYDGFLDLY